MSERERRQVVLRALIAAEPAGPVPVPVKCVDHLGQLCRAVARTLSAQGAAVTVMTAEGVQSLAVASDPKTQTLEEQQLSFGEGPCVEAFAGRHPVLEADLGRRTVRWSAYAPAALGQGVRAVFAFPLQIGAARLGVLNVYRDRPGGLSEPTLLQAQTFAELAVQVLLEGQAEARTNRPIAGLEAAMESRSELFQAQGMVMMQLGVSLAEAMSRLRAHAYAQDRRLGDVARDVVTHELELESDRMSGGAG